MYKKQFSKNIYGKINILNKLKTYCFIKNNQETQNLIKTALNEAKNGFMAKRGYLRLEAKVDALISQGVANSKSNIFLTNFPRFANTIDNTYEQVTADHVYDTLINHSLSTSKPLFVLPLSNTTYIALMPSSDDARHIVKTLNGMMCNNEILQLKYINEVSDISIDKSLAIQPIRYAKKYLLWVFIGILMELAVLYYISVFR